MDIEEVLKRRQPPTKSVRLLLDQTLSDRFQQVEREAGRAKMRAENSNDRQVQIDAAELARQADDLKQQIEDAYVTFTFQGISRVDYNELLEAHPPTEEHTAGGFEFDPDGFGPDLIAACSVDPEISPEQARRIWDEWTEAEVVRLFNAAYESNRVVKDVPFIAAGSGTPRSSGPS